MSSFIIGSAISQYMMANGYSVIAQFGACMTAGILIGLIGRQAMK